MLHRMGIALAVLLALACGNLEAWAQKVGLEFQVNSFTTSNQEQPSVARLSNGGFVVTWQSAGQDGSGVGIYGQRYSAAGVPVGVEFLVNTVTANNQSQPSVAGLTGGRFVVTWQSVDSSLSGVYGQRYSGAGVREGSEFRINITTPDHQQSPSVAGLSGGGFVVIWQSFAQDGSANGVYGRRYSPTGVRIGGEFQVNTWLSGGGFVVIWKSTDQDGSSYGIYGQRYSAAGARAGSEFRANTHTTFAQTRPCVAGLSGGGFVVTWESAGQTGGLGNDVYGQRYGATGTRAGGEFRVNTYTALDQWESSVAGLSGGGFIVTWASRSQDEHLHGVYGQRYGATGAPAGSEFRVNTVRPGNQDFPSVAGLSDGGFIVTFQSNNSGGGIYGQRYNATGAPVGGEFQINTTTGTRRFPSVAGLDKGEFVAAWDATHAVYGQRFASPAPKITLNPVSRTARAGTTVTFTADASGSPTPTVRWQQRVPGQRLFTNIPSATAKTLTFQAALAQNGYQYRAVFSNLAGTANSSAATLTVSSRRSLSIAVDLSPPAPARVAPASALSN